MPPASLLFKSLAECSGRRAPSAAAGTRHDGGPLVLCQQRFLGSWREHSGFARRRCQRRTQLECSRNAVLRQLCFKLGTFAYEDIEGVIQYSDRKHHGTCGRNFCCSRAGRGAPKNCATMVCVFGCKGVVGSIYTGKSHIKLAVGNPETDLTALPDTLPVVADVAETSSESDCDLDSFVPKLTRTRLEIWREHSTFAIGLRMAELATMWCVQGWQKDSFGQFTNWLKQQAPDLIGTVNHSTRFLNGFQASLIQACHTGAASSLHALLPATGTPSFLSRIIDVVSINSASLLPTIHMYTTCEGKLSWVLLDCPCLEHIGEAARSTAAVGTAATGTAAVGVGSQVSVRFAPTGIPPPYHGAA